MRMIFAGEAGLCRLRITRPGLSLPDRASAAQGNYAKDRHAARTTGFAQRTVLSIGLASVWHDGGMPRTRVSTTVDEQLLKSARQALAPLPDAAVLDQALAALLDRRRAAEIDAAYAIYDERPLDEPDAWGDLASFREAAAAS